MTIENGNRRGGRWVWRQERGGQHAQWQNCVVVVDVVLVLWIWWGCAASNRFYLKMMMMMMMMGLLGHGQRHVRLSTEIKKLN